jgi:hypothetical protein
MRNTTLPLMKYGIQYIRTHLKLIWSTLNYFIIQLLGGRRVVQTIDGNMLKRVWQELDYRIDIYRVMKGAHIEHL